MPHARGIPSPSTKHEHNLSQLGQLRTHEKVNGCFPLKDANVCWWSDSFNERNKTLSSV